MSDFDIFIHGQYIYWITALLMSISLYIIVAYPNLIKKLIGLALFQVSVFILFILIAKVDMGVAPILTETTQPYSNPLPHVLILTAIVVSISSTALGLSLIVRIHDTWHSLDEEDFK